MVSQPQRRFQGAVLRRPGSRPLESGRYCSRPTAARTRRGPTVSDLHRIPTLGQLLKPEFSASRLIAAGMSEIEASAKGRRFATAAKKLVDSGHDPEVSAFAVF